MQDKEDMIIANIKWKILNEEKTNKVLELDKSEDSPRQPMTSK